MKGNNHCSLFTFSLFTFALPYNGDNAVVGEFDDVGGGGGGALIAAGEADIVNGVLNLGGNVAEGLWGGLAADVGTGADDGAMHVLAEEHGENLAGKSYAYAAVVGEEVGGETAAVVVDDGEGRVGAVDELPRNVGDVLHMLFEASLGINEADEGLGVHALLYLIDAAHGFGIAGVAAEAPDGIGGVEDDSSFFHYAHGFAYIVEIGAKTLPQPLP